MQPLSPGSHKAYTEGSWLSALVRQSREAASHLDQALLQAKTQSSWQALWDQLGKHGVRQLQRLEDCLVKSVELHGHLDQRDTHVIQPM